MHKNFYKTKFSETYGIPLGHLRFLPFTFFFYEKSRLELVNSKVLIEHKVYGKKHRCPFRNSVETKYIHVYD